MATTISSPVTLTCTNATKYAEYLSSLSANQALTNVVGDEPSLTITFNYTVTIEE